MTAAPSSTQLPRPGDMIAGKYVLDRLLGQGGMGAVFAARHLKLSKAVAIKIMLADASNPEAATRFINEGRAAANIQNEHVVRVDDVDEEMGYAYMVLELLDGEDLSQVLERDPAHKLIPHVAVGHVLQALRGVMAAHAIGIVHRDLKPSNLFLARRKDGSIVVKVLDFGISKAQGSSALAASPNALTSTKAMLGSPLYMSPEQLRSSKSVDHRADIWAIGVILYELISGALPFMGDNLGELFANILETDPIPLRQRVDGVSPGLDEVVLRCLARKPEQRFQNANELVNALAAFATPQPGFTGTNQMMYPGMPGQHSVPQTQASPGMQSTPNNMVRPSVPHPGAVTSGSGPRVIQGTVQLGAVTPPQGGLQQTGSGGWQSAEGTVPKSRMGLVIGIIATFFLVTCGTIGAVLIYKSREAAKHIPTTPEPSSTIASSAQTTTPSSTVSVAATTPSAVPSATPTTTTTTTTPSQTAGVATTKPTGHHPVGPATGTTAATTKVDPKPPPPPPPPDPTPKKPPPPTPSNTSGGLQNSR